MDKEALQLILEPLLVLTPRERQIFLEYHYFNTHMKILAKDFKISLGRVYEVLHKAEAKLLNKNQKVVEGTTRCEMKSSTKGGIRDTPLVNELEDSLREHGVNIDTYSEELNSEINRGLGKWTDK